MPRGNKVKAELLSELRKRAETSGMSIEQVLAEIEKESIKEGVIKPTLDNHPDVKTAVELAEQWCKKYNRRIIIHPGKGIKLSAVKSAETQAEAKA